VEGADGAKEWHQNGIRHRDDGPAVEGLNGYQEWWAHGQLHREDGPAIEGGADGYTAWYQHGELHREDGPAVANMDGSEHYYLHDQEVAPEIAQKMASLYHLRGTKLETPEKVVF
jgi:hypothetical protein